MKAAALLVLVAVTPGCTILLGENKDYHEVPTGSAGGVQLAAGVDHACALLGDGDVWCWGGNGTGQLGRRVGDGGAQCTTACPPGPVEGITGAAQISAGDGFTCAVVGGAVSCWGLDSTGQLGRSVTTMCGGEYCDPVPAGVEGVSGAVQVSAGGTHACARTAKGSVVCWGDNSYGQLGTGDLMSRPSPTPVQGVAGAVDVSAALVGKSTCVATGDGRVLCWGVNNNGAAGHTPGGSGDVTSADAEFCAVTPQAVAGVEGAVAAGTCGFAACAQLATSGFVCWGYDGLGALGLSGAGTAVVVLPPEPVTAVPNLVALGLGSTTACGFDPAGEAWCWGQSGFGALGPEKSTPATCDQMVLCQPKAQDVGLSSVTQIAVGAAFALAARADGTVWAWGLNGSGQLGHPPGTQGDAACPADTTRTCSTKPLQVQGLPQ